MGRLFVIELEGPVYKCKYCQTDLGVPSDIDFRVEFYQKSYWFSRLFNIFLVATTFPHMSDVLCVGCCASICSNHVKILLQMGEDYHVLRRSLHGPEGSDDEV